MDWYSVKKDLGSSLVQDRKWNSGLYIRLRVWGRLRSVVTSEARIWILGGVGGAHYEIVAVQLEAILDCNVPRVGSLSHVPLT